MRFLLPLVISLVSCTAFPAFAAEKIDDAASGNAVIRELNLARQNPALYAKFVQELRSRLNGNVLVLPGHTRIRTKEGTAALDEAIRFLQNARPLPPSPGSRVHARRSSPVEVAAGGSSNSTGANGTVFASRG